ncbi:MAG: class I SAM-dependent methyltransferase [Novosphingobium sp.]|uniref:class I SAM-dependent methyltransferase n=1 Tax=Novosphingobium sp. TaxID=1874826 RepID=UPI0032BBA394
MNSDAFAYEGAELEHFALALNWKRYVKARLAPFLAGQVVEVGAGLGETARTLRPGLDLESWLCIEPDPAMAAQIGALAASGALGEGVSVLAGTLREMPAEARADTVIYVDVLEHIEHDAAELRAAAELLRPGGRLVVLAPAYNYLFSPFDKAVGHYRRYTKTMLRAILPAGLSEEAAFYMDSVGLMASLANKLLLKQSLPSADQVKVWDRLMVPVSRLIDPLLGHSCGRSVVLVWRKPG